ncbi:MAG: alpha/beta hydrolase [Thaumarchaeota archaeon]|nr:alpha/beta hydrolase [Nitrososphaerota archaeon]
MPRKAARSKAVHPKITEMHRRMEEGGVAIVNPLATIESSRKRLAKWVKVMYGRPIHLREATDTEIEGPLGPIPVRIYKPLDQKSGSSMIVYFHGGGWILGDLDTDDEPARYLCKLSGGVVVSVDYRLAPEYKFPAGAEDCYRATLWASKNASALGCDPRKLVVVGDCAGGNLAAVVCLLAKKRKEPRIALQILVYPITDLSRDMSKFAGAGGGSPPEEWIWLRKTYLSDVSEAEDPIVSPLLGDLRGLPPTMMITADLDEFREQEEEYVDKLRKAGIRVRSINYSRMLHGFWNFPDHFEAGMDAVRKAAAEIRRL